MVTRVQGRQRMTGATAEYCHRYLPPAPTTWTPATKYWEMICEAKHDFLVKSHYLIHPAASKVLSAGFWRVLASVPAPSAALSS